MVLDTRVYIEDIAKNLNIKTGTYCGHFYLDFGDYRAYVVNAHEYANMAYDKSFQRDHVFEWVIKRATDDPTKWEEIFRKGVRHLTSKLKEEIPYDIQKLMKIIEADIEIMKSKYNPNLANIAKKCGLDITSKNVRDGLLMAYNLGKQSNK